MNTNNVLFVVYDFPPEGVRGTKRSINFIRYLPPNGWSPVVLTVRNPRYDFYDGSLLADLPENLPIHRARTLESLIHRRRYERHEVYAPAVDTSETPTSSVLRRMVLWIYRGIGRFVSIPDSCVLWLPFAVSMGLKLIKRNGCRVIYSSGPSHTNHVVAAILSRRTGLPLVLDFRDAWVGNPARRRISAWTEKGHVRLERFCLRSAKFVVCTTDGMKADFKQRYPDLSPRYETIFNGFDPLDFPADSGNGKSAKRPVLTIVHSGTLGFERSPKQFLSALGQLLREKPELRGHIEVTFVGKNSPFSDGRTIADYIDEYGCGSAVTLTGYVSRQASLDYTRKADVLLLIIGRVPKAGAFVYGISGKIYDYAAARKPVFTVAEPGSTAELANRLNLGPIVHPDDTEGIKSTLSFLVDAHQNGRIPYSPHLELLKSFEFSSLTARLAECFHEACASKTDLSKVPLLSGSRTET